MKKRAPKTPRKKQSAKRIAVKAREQGIVAKGKSHTALREKYSPFPAVRNYTFSYENGAVTMAPGTATVQYILKPNSLYDIDGNLSAPFGNHQPVDFSKLLSSTGPYHDYKVNSWDIEITLINQSVSPLAGYIVGSSAQSSDWDTFNECVSFPPASKIVTGKHSD